MSGYNVLSLDGGGCRGVVTAVFIEALAERAPDFLGRVQLFAGTSIGAANALALASDRGPRSMVGFYRTQGPQLFAKRMRPPGLLGLVTRVLGSVPGVGGLVDEVSQLFLPKWSNEGLRRALREYFGDNSTLRDLEPRRVLLPALALDGELRDSRARVVLPVGVHNFPSSRFLDTHIHEAALWSMSAPTFFQSAGGYVDGGVFANNPSIVALAAAAQYADERTDDVRMLSIGTGICPDAIESDGPLEWGVIKWGESYPEVSMRAVSEFDHLQCRALLGKERYCRLNVVLPRDVPMDDVAAIPELEAVARKAVDGPEFAEALRFVEAHFG